MTVSTAEKPQSSTHLPPLSVAMDNTKSVPRPELVHKLEGCTDQVNGAVILPGEDGVISISDDRRQFQH